MVTLQRPLRGVGGKCGARAAGKAELLAVRVAADFGTWAAAYRRAARRNARSGDSAHTDALHFTADELVTLLDQAVVVVLATDADARIVAVGAAVERVLGQRPESWKSVAAPGPYPTESGG